MTLTRRRWSFVSATSFALALAAVSLAGPATAPVEVAPGAPAAAADRKATLSQFMRFVDQGVAGGRLETADVVYVNDAGAVVRLVSAVHIGEGAYFKGLADSFRERDAVLYELVKPRDGAVPVPGVEREATHGVAQLQRFLKDTLNLEYQLDQIDYSAPNFVHADLDAETFEKMQAERGESFATLMLQQLMKAMSQPPDVAFVDIGLPRMDGYEVARTIRRSEQAANVYLVALTGYGRPEDRARALAAGFDVHLVKPLEIHRVTELMERRPRRSVPRGDDWPRPRPAAGHH